MFLKIGAIGFGGGVAMLAIIRKSLVSEKKWISDNDLATAVALGQMIPGPFVPNYVEYIGFRLRGIKGMITSVVAFLLPGVIAIMFLSYLYFQTQRVVLINDIFLWIQPVIIGILVWATVDMAKLYLKDIKSYIITIFALTTSLIKIEPIIIILICGAIGVFFTRRQSLNLFSLFPYFLLIGTGPFLIQTKNFSSLTLIFLKIGTLIFGGGYAAVPFISQEIVITKHWLTSQELLTGVALSQITPGPVAIVATFIGYKVSGILGALATTIAIFLPSFFILLIILSVYHQFIRTSKNVQLLNFLQVFISAVKPAIVGFLISATITLAINHGVLIANSLTITIIRILFLIISFILLFRFKVSPVWLILGSAGFGFILTRMVL